ncbi:methyl-accepting chemotaxis protein [Colwelliaceae bacterium 6471]
MTTNQSGKEQTFSDNDFLLSITDLDSYIKYANKEFCDIAGFTIDELQGKPHNVVRHPTMPKAAFKDLWSFVQQGRSWMGPVKNRCKNGDYYWVNAFVTPIKDDSGNNVEYQSVRTKLDQNVKQRAEETYQKLNKGETPLALKFSTDQTLWFQSCFILLTVLTAALTLFSETSLLFSLPIFVICVLSTGIFMQWRKKYTKVVNEAKSVFNNPLMAYLYAGNNDAVGNIQLALTMRKAEINAVVGRVTDVSMHVSEMAASTSDKNHSVSESLSQQRNESEQVATAINEMSATVQDLARTISGAAQATEQGKELTEQGKEVVKSTVNAIDDLSQQLAEVDSMISRLADGSKSISSVLSEISSIADQTNLLALNAAIEAARAGEQGRGFAVVAEEVRALAMRTQQSTEEINKLLGQLQTDSSNAINAMTKSNELSENCVSLSKQTGDALDSILNEVTQISDSTAQIATAIEQQSVVTEEVSENVVRISELSISCEDNSLEATTLSSGLLDKLTEQQSLVLQFRN